MKDLDPINGGCWICSKDECDSFTIEWDSYFHWNCLEQYVNWKKSDKFDPNFIDPEIECIVREFDLDK